MMTLAAAELASGLLEKGAVKLSPAEPSTCSSGLRAPTYCDNRQLLGDVAMRARIADLTEYGKHIARAPACIAVFCQETKYYLADGSAATQNILLAATAHGVGSCWVGGDKKPFADDIRRLLGMPANYKLVSLVALGYPAETPRREKRPLADVLHWERFHGGNRGQAE